MSVSLHGPIAVSPLIQAVSWQDETIILLDQTALPKSEVYLHCHSTECLVTAIQNLVVRGAPAIGIAGAYGVVLATLEALKLSDEKARIALKFKLKTLEMARPTAVNLQWAVGRLKKIIEDWKQSLNLDLVKLLLAEAKQIHEQDIACNHLISKFGSELLKEGPVITICNTGDLATGGIGTAFGILVKGYQIKKTSHVYACETRPVLQGLRLTSWELHRHSIPFTVICDNMAAALMRKEKISAVITGADRIAANGDVANKIGTYALAVLAKAHSVPFYVAAPFSTFDFSLSSGESIPIEERSHDEVLSVLGDNHPEYAIPVWNPSFDVTPQSLISAIICDRGVINFPNQERIKASFSRNQP